MIRKELNYRSRYSGLRPVVPCEKHERHVKPSFIKKNNQINMYNKQQKQRYSSDPTKFDDCSQYIGLDRLLHGCLENSSLLNVFHEQRHIPAYTKVEYFCCHPSENRAGIMEEL